MIFHKNDITALPFDKLYQKIYEKTADLKEERLAALRLSIEHANTRKIKTTARDVRRYFDSETGTEGLEEGISEALSLTNPDDVELDAETRAACLEDARKLIIPSFLQTFDIAVKYTWIMPQLRAYFGSWKPIKDEDGVYLPRDTVLENCQDDFSKGVWHLAMWSRSDLIGGQNVRLYQVGEYNNLVPLILNGFKVMQGIPYSAWSRTGLKNIVDVPLAEAMLANVPDLTSNQWLEVRKDCLVIQTGSKSGQDRDPRTTAMLYGIPTYTKYDLKGIPKLALVMKAQIWCAHPANRTVHMVLDPKDWDNMPNPLIDTNPVPKKTDIFNKKPTKTTDELLLWA